ncbi:hypothetical protein IAU59_002185 [Kwoniella sp. CBS 9459]
MLFIKPIASLSLLIALTSFRIARGSGSMISLELDHDVEYFDGLGEVFENPYKGPNTKPLNFVNYNDPETMKFRIVMHDPEVPPEKWTRNTRQWIFDVVAGSWLRDTADHRASFKIERPEDPTTNLDWLVRVDAPEGQRVGVWSLNAKCVRSDGACPDDKDQFPHLGTPIEDFPTD